MNLKCLIVDDDPSYRELLQHFVEQHPELELIECYEDATAASKYLSNNNVDLLFLDVEMPGISGIDLVKSSKIVPQVIFITSHTEYAAEAFEHDVTDYIVKPVNEQRFSKAIDKAIAISKYQEMVAEQEYIYFKVDSKTVKTRMMDITSIESMGDYMLLYENGNRHIILGSLNGAQNTLGKDNFMRIHRKYIVRLDAIEKVDGTSVLLSDGNEFQVSRANKSELTARLKQRSI